MNTLEIQQTQAQELVQTLSLPSFSYGSGMIANLSELDFKNVLKQESSSSVTITVPKEVQVANVQELDETFVGTYAQGLIKADENKLLAAQFRRMADTKVILIPKNAKCTENITININSKDISSFTNVILVVEEGANANIVERFESGKGALYQGHTVQLYVEKNAVVTYNSVQNNSNTTYQFVTKRAKVAKDACVRFVDVLVGSKYSQVLLNTQLVEQGANAQSYVLYYGDDNQVFDLDTQMKHVSCNTHGNMLSHGALKDTSNVLYRGNIYVAPGSSAVNSTQKSNTLVVGKKAQCNAVPVLDVHNDDVTCSHGAAIGQVDENLLYYLQSRGFSREDAVQEILEGMFEPIITKITDVGLQNEIRNLLLAKGKKDE